MILRFTRTTAAGRRHPAEWDLLQRRGPDGAVDMAPRPRSTSCGRWRQSSGCWLREEGVGHRMISQTRAVLGHAGHSLGTVVAQAETAPA